MPTVTNLALQKLQVTEALATIKITIEGEYSNLADGEDETIKQMAQAKFQAEGDREAFVIDSITVAPGSIIVTIVFAAGSDTDTITSIGVDIANNGIDGYKVLAVDSNTQAQDKSFVSLGYTVVTNPVRGHGKNGVTFINGVRQDDASSTSSGNSKPKKNKKAKKVKSSSAGTDSLMKGQSKFVAFI